MKTPVPNAVAAVAAKEAKADLAMPEGAARWAVVFDGTETADEVKAALKEIDP